MQFFDVEQSSSEWFELRRGVATASRFSKIITPGGKPSGQRKKLICEIISEQMSMIPPERVETFSNRAMQWGQAAEAEARRYFEMTREVTVTNGGFCLSHCGRFGSSPDGLIGDDGVLELKAPMGNTQAEYLIDGGLPDEYKPQCHGHLVVTGRDYCDFLSYSVGLPPLLVRVVPNEYTKELRIALEIFWTDLQEAISRVKES